MCFPAGPVLQGGGGDRRGWWHSLWLQKSQGASGPCRDRRCFPLLKHRSGRKRPPGGGRGTRIQLPGFRSLSSHLQAGREPSPWAHRRPLRPLRPADGLQRNTCHEDLSGCSLPSVHEASSSLTQVQMHQRTLWSLLPFEPLPPWGLNEGPQERGDADPGAQPGLWSLASSSQTLNALLGELHDEPPPQA